MNLTVRDFLKRKCDVQGATVVPVGNPSAKIPSFVVLHLVIFFSLFKQGERLELAYNIHLALTTESSFGSLAIS